MQPPVETHGVAHGFGIARTEFEPDRRPDRPGGSPLVPVEDRGGAAGIIRLGALRMGDVAIPCGAALSLVAVGRHAAQALTEAEGSKTRMDINQPAEPGIAQEIIGDVLDGLRRPGWRKPAVVEAVGVRVVAELDR